MIPVDACYHPVTQRSIGKFMNWIFCWKKKIFQRNYQNCSNTFVNSIFYYFFLQGARIWVRKTARAPGISVGLIRSGREKETIFDSWKRCKNQIIKLALVKICRQFFTFFCGFYIYFDELLTSKRHLRVPQTKVSLSSYRYWIFLMVVQYRTP